MHACEENSFLISVTTQSAYRNFSLVIYKIFHFSNEIFQPFYTPAKVSLYVGDPIDVVALSEGKTDKPTLQRVSIHCIAEIGKLAGLKDWKPEMAGKTWLEKTPD